MDSFFFFLEQNVHLSSVEIIHFTISQEIKDGRKVATATQRNHSTFKLLFCVDLRLGAHEKSFDMNRNELNEFLLMQTCGKI